MAQAVIRARTDLDASGFNKGISAMQASAMKLKGFVAGAFTGGAVLKFSHNAISAVGDLNDVAEMFGITAGEVDGFTQAVRDAGGNTEKASAILRTLHAAQQQLGDTRPLSAFVDETVLAYKETGNFSEVVRILGTKNAALFVSAMNSATGAMKDFKDEATDAAAKSADAIGEKVDGTWRKIQLGFAKTVNFLVSGVEGLAEGAGSIAGGGNYLDRYIKAGEDERKAIIQAEIDRLDLLLATQAMVDKALTKSDDDAYAQTLRERKFISNEFWQEELKRLNDADDLARGIEFEAAEKNKPTPERDFTRDVNFDSLRRIGFNSLGAGRSQNDVASILKRAEDYQKQIAINTAKMADNRGGTTF